MSADRKKVFTVDIKYYFYIIIKKIWLVILLSVLSSSATTYIYYSNYIPLYEASATLLVIKNNSSEIGNVTEIISYNDVLVDQQLVKEFKEIIKSKLVGKAVIEDLAISSITYRDYVNIMSVNLKPDTRILELKVKHIDPKVAQLIANKASEVFIQKVHELMKTENVVIIDKADQPGSPIPFNLKKNALLGGVVGLLLSLLIIFLIEELDDTLKTIDDVEDIFGLKVLGTIPDLKIRTK
ncbi:MAG: Wzz/FepE/Etk N-terminal domain-containing protein [Clostridia bacterium]|nr:Wzz/FepE/Etk N-terminal domain-containing protein [Clostridia bacterium]